MFDEPTVGQAPHRRSHAQPSQKAIPTLCTTCRGRATGYDARRAGPACRPCARLRPDGGSEPVVLDARQHAPRAWFGDEPATVGPLDALQRDILAAVALDEPRGADHGRPYGLSLKHALEGFRDERINDNRLYPALRELVDAGMLRTAGTDQRTNFYAFTRDGRVTLGVYAQFLADAAGAAGIRITAPEPTVDRPVVTARPEFRWGDNIGGDAQS